MRSNKITKFSKIDFKQLEIINLGHNQITKVTIGSPDENSLKEVSLDLRFNKISFIEFDYTSLLSNEKFKIDLFGNPLICDWNLVRLNYAWNVTKQFDVNFGNQKCSEPESLNGRAISKSFKADDLLSASLNNTHFNCILSCLCSYDFAFKSLFINCSNFDIESPPVVQEEIDPALNLVDINLISLDLTNNSLRNLPNLQITSKFNVTEIFARNNFIDELSIKNLNENLQIIDLRNNKLTSLSSETIENLRQVKNVSLGNNPWQCKCSQIDFFNGIKSLKNIIVDYNDLSCENLGKAFDDLGWFDLCFDMITFLAVCGAVFGVIGIVVGIFYKFKKEIKIFLYAHNMCLWFAGEDELDEDKLFDAFVCFAAPDQTIVEDIILELESEANGFKCLVGVRDWPPGEMLTQLVSFVLF